MSETSKRSWRISPGEAAGVAGILSFLMAILLPSTIMARARPRRDTPPATATELRPPRLMEEAGYHGWVYLIGAVLCGATVAALVYAAAASIRRRSGTA